MCYVAWLDKSVLITYAWKPVLTVRMKKAIFHVTQHNAKNRERRDSAVEIHTLNS